MHFIVVNGFFFCLEYYWVQTCYFWDSGGILYFNQSRSELRLLETVSSTFQDLEFDGSLQPLYTC